jgi:hypothetical protein
MDFNKRQQAFLYLGRDKFDFYGTGFGNVLTFPFSQITIRDLEILNDVQFQAEIEQFIQQNNIPAENITLIFAPTVLFEKDIVTTSVPEDTQKFLDSVPFENILSNTVPIENGVRVFAANKSFYEIFQTTFSKNGSIIETVIPYFVFGQDYAILDTLDAQTASSILKRIDSVKKLTMMQSKTDQTKTQGTSEIKNESNKKQAKIRLYGMVGLFSFLLLILGIMLFNQ